MHCMSSKGTIETQTWCVMSVDCYRDIMRICSCCFRGDFDDIYKLKNMI